MNEIIFATSNSGKVATLQSHLAIHGLGDIEVVQSTFDLIEPQATTALEVASSKASQAYQITKAPVLVDDSSFHIYALGGFPGPYIKYMLDTVGAEGIVRFMKGTQDRRAYGMSALVFIDDKGGIHTFSVQGSDGSIAEEVRESVDDSGWSDLWKIFIPAGSTKTLSQMTPEDHEMRHKSESGRSSYNHFAEWLKEYLDTQGRS